MNGNHFILIVIIGIAAYVLLNKEEEWTGVLYPDRSNLYVHEIVGKFESLEDCRNVVIGRIDRLADPNAADWECGLNCEPTEIDPDMMICEKTER